MSQAWYIHHNGRAVGPVTAAKLKQLAGEAKIGPKTRLRLGDEGQWLNAERVKGLFPAAAADHSTVSTTPQPAGRGVNGQSDESQKTRSSPLRGKPGSGNPYESPAPIDHTDTVSTGTSSVPLKHGLRQAFWSVWFKPRQTIRWSIAERPARDAIIIAMTSFGLQFVDNCLLTNEDSPIDGGLILAPIGVPISDLFGIVILYVFGFMHKIVGEAIGGNGDYRSLRTAFAWSLVPTIVSLPTTLLLLIIAFLVPSILMVPNWLLNLPFTILFVWGIVIEVAGISAAHGFSIVRGIITFVVSAIILVLAIMIAVTGAVMLAF